jgi:hypothetical protein
MKFLSSYRINQRREAKKVLGKLDNASRKVLIIHYSCESFYDKAGFTPRVTCIGILNRENNESLVFSIHLHAQILHKDIRNLPAADLDAIEKQMLDEFAAYVRDHMNYVWIHWNMRSANYGFQAISNRYRILGGDTISIPDTNKLDLPKVLGQLYTYGFEKHKPFGQLLNLAARNRVSNRDALPGIEEAKAFEDGNFLNLQMSTMRKVEIIDRLLTAQDNGTLKHNASIKDVYDLTIPGIILMVKESPLLFLIWTIIIFIVGAAVEPLIQKIFGTSN